MTVYTNRFFLNEREPLSTSSYKLISTFAAGNGYLAPASGYTDFLLAVRTLIDAMRLIGIHTGKLPLFLCQKASNLHLMSEIPLVFCGAFRNISGEHSKIGIDHNG